MSWAGLTLVTDADIGQFEPEATNGHWRQTTWPNQRAQAKLELQSWIDTDYLDVAGPSASDKVRDTYGPDKLWGYTGGTFTEFTTEATDETEDDVNLATVFTTVGTDRLYIGGLTSFDGLDVTMLTTLNANTSALTVKYHGPAGWTSLTATDGTATTGKTFAKSGRITWTQPGDWQRRTLNDSSDAYYWIELSVSAALTANTRAGQIQVIKPPIVLKRIALLLAMGYIVMNLAAQAPSTDYWMYKARNQFKTGFLDQAELRYSELKAKGGLPVDLNNDGTIDLAEVTLVRPIRLGRA